MSGKQSLCIKPVFLYSIKMKLILQLLLLWTCVPSLSPDTPVSPEAMRMNKPAACLTNTHTQAGLDSTPSTLNHKLHELQAHPYLAYSSLSTVHQTSIAIVSLTPNQLFTVSQTSLIIKNYNYISHIVQSHDLVYSPVSLGYNWEWY